MVTREKNCLCRGNETLQVLLFCIGLFSLFFFMNGCATAPDLSKEPYPIKKQNFAHNAGISESTIQPAVVEAEDSNQIGPVEEPNPEQLTSADAENEAKAVPEEVPSPPESAESAETIASPDSPLVESTEENSVVLQPYDTVRFRFLYWPELDDEQVIRPDGKISLLMVGDVEAQGKTPAALQAELTQLYDPLLKEPEINVAVSSLASNRAYVFGSVLTPGMILLEGKLTLLSAIAQAGGFIEERANKSMIVVVRDINGEQFARSINLKDALKNPQSDTFYIEPYDIVYVPETTIVKMNQFVAQYIDGLIPNHISFGASYSLGGKAATRISTSNNNAAWQKLPALNFSTGK